MVSTFDSRGSRKNTYTGKNIVYNINRDKLAISILFLCINHNAALLIKQNVHFYFCTIRCQSTTITKTKQIYTVLVRINRKSVFVTSAYEWNVAHCFLYRGNLK